VIEIDVADRCRGALESLAATYLVPLDGGAVVEASPARIAWSPLGPGRGGLELLALATSRLALTEAGPRATIVQAVATIEPGTFTHRLRYRWTWTSSGSGAITR
jgi:hypothetical protein